MRAAQLVSNSLTKRIRFTNIFSKVPMAPPDAVLGINVAFANDSDSRKVNLGVGAYRDENLKPVVFSVVRKIQEQLLADKSLNLVRLAPLRSTSRSTASRATSRAARTSSSARTPRC